MNNTRLEITGSKKEKSVIPESKKRASLPFSLTLLSLRIETERADEAENERGEEEREQKGQ